MCLRLLVAVIFYLLLVLAGDVEVNPGPLRNLTLNIGHINARSLNVEDKFDEISTLVLDLNLDIFAVSETWLNHSMASDSLSIGGFSQIYRLDRCDGRRAGGVALYISSSFASKRRFDLEHVNFELLFVEIVINSITFVCGVCYRPPNYNAEDNNAFLDNLQSSLDNIYLKPDTFVLLLGDFNGHYDTAYPSLSSVFGTRFYSWMACNNLFQVINEPTRITLEGATLLDLIITNLP
jgi:hypothetical protein